MCSGPTNGMVLPSAVGMGSALGVRVEIYLGIGDWGLGIGALPQPPTPNPLLESHHAFFQPGLLPLEHALGQPVGPVVLVGENRAEQLPHLAAAMPAEHIGHPDRAAVGGVL